MITNKTRAAIVHLLGALSPESVRLLMLKHVECDLDVDTGTLLTYMADASPDQLSGLLLELLTDRTSIRNDAPVKYVFDTRRTEVRGLLRADGFEPQEETLIRLNPAAETIAQVTDELDQVLATSDLDLNGSIREILKQSHACLAAVPADFNAGSTKARIALETVARRSAAAIAQKRNQKPCQDTWGASLQFLRAAGIISTIEEDALAKVYTLISPGSHLPKGLTDEQWALLSRTYAISGAYFLARRHMCAESLA